ncbi:MBL fold metallo-hydrolase [Vannielia litorea]|uniref:MBL fold metallo-hydrolase n=1 Tax=Vannielia litorea TaxID=1217970 RepID=UPI001C941A79|nr:MBL fold metallo-hydrolase [Vannielia litorea]MBY6049645.1 MBL fold metallo-hydrolase [Vannielia litorea]MBY6077059.1 MBL fold metallo-hydrolase [Vannielia litorea]MBY6155698.1 MBL fold metallo-hydrolase [Vannielia litorea]
MTQTRRTFLATVAASAGAITVLPYALRAEAHGGDMFETANGSITIHPVDHASFVMESPAGTIYVDPVGDAAAYADFPAPDLILVTHEHGDHFNAETLAAIKGEAHLITNPAVAEKLADMAPDEVLANGESTEWNGVAIDAIPAYNITEGRTDFHPEGRDNGYVLTIDGFRTYVSGDTEDIPEMRALEDIDLAFVCMNLPFTMTAEQAASAVKEFAPTYVYPYHYRGRDDGTQDPEAFAALVADTSEVKFGDWYHEMET